MAMPKSALSWGIRSYAGGNFPRKIQEPIKSQVCSQFSFFSLQSKSIVLSLSRARCWWCSHVFSKPNSFSKSGNGLHSRLPPFFTIEISATCLNSSSAGNNPEFQILFTCSSYIYLLLLYVMDFKNIF